MFSYFNVTNVHEITLCYILHNIEFWVCFDVVLHQNDSLTKLDPLAILPMVGIKVECYIYKNGS